MSKYFLFQNFMFSNLILNFRIAFGLYLLVIIVATIVDLYSTPEEGTSYTITHIYIRHILHYIIMLCSCGKPASEYILTVYEFKANICSC